MAARIAHHIVSEHFVVMKFIRQSCIVSRLWIFATAANIINIKRYYKKKKKNSPWSHCPLRHNTFFPASFFRYINTMHIWLLWIHSFYEVSLGTMFSISLYKRFVSGSCFPSIVANVHKWTVDMREMIEKWYCLLFSDRCELNKLGIQIIICYFVFLSIISNIELVLFSRLLFNRCSATENICLYVTI